MLAWYFSTDDCMLRYGDNRRIIAGKMHTIKGAPELCERGLHASERILDALSYAPGAHIWRVNITRHVQVGDDKICGQRRAYLWGFNANGILGEFARKQALINIDKIKPHTDQESLDLIKSWLITGDPSRRSAAWSAAESAARSTAYSAAWSAAWSAAESEVWSAAYSAAWYAAESAVRSAARSAALSAANTMLETMILDHYERTTENSHD